MVRMYGRLLTVFDVLRSAQLFEVAAFFFKDKLILLMTSCKYSANIKVLFEESCVSTANSHHFSGSL